MFFLAFLIDMAVETQTRKQNGGHCDVIYDVIIPWITVNAAEKNASNTYYSKYTSWQSIMCI